MAYNKVNYYKRIIAIQEIVIEKQALGIPNTRIFKDYIEVRFLIAESTFKKYLGVPAKRELKKLERELSEANTKPSKLENEKQNPILSKSQGNELGDTGEAKAVLFVGSDNVPVLDKDKDKDEDE